MTETAKEILQQIGLKYSKQRAAIIDLLIKAEQPLNAAEITQKLNDRNEEKQTYWPSTVYRTLEHLLQTGIISKLEMPGSEQGSFIFQGHSHDQHVAVCTSCQKVFPLPDCPLHHSSENLAAQGFLVTGHRIEIYGHCADCQEDENTSPLNKNHGQS